MAQEPFHFNIGSNELTGVDIYSITEKKSGEIVLSTDNGIYEYDGYKFINTLAPKGYSNSLFGLTKDSDGTIFCYDLGQNIYKYSNESLELFYRLPESVSNGYMSICFDVNDDLIIKKGDYYRLTRNKEFIKLLDVRSSASDLVYRNNRPILFDHSKNDIFFLEDGKLQLIAKDLKRSVIHGHPYTVMANSELYLVSSSFSQVLKIKDNKTEVIRDVFDSASDKLSRFYQLNDSLFIIVKKKGESSIVNIKTGLKLNKQPLFKGYYISSVYEDINGGMWLGTFKRGIIFIPNLNSITFDNVIKDESFTAIAKNKYKDIFIGAFNGNVYKIDSSQNLTLFTHSESDRDVLSIKDVPQNDRLWINSNLFDYSGNSNEADYLHISTKHISKINNSIYGFSGGRSFILMNVFGRPIMNNMYPSFIEKHFSKKSWLIMTTKSNDYSYYDKTNNTIFITTETGLKKIEEKTVSELKFENKPIRVTEIIKSEERLFIATLNSGLLLLKDNILHAYFKRNEFNGPIHNLKIDKQTIYFSSNEKIFFFNEKDRVLRKIDLRYGLKPDKIIDFLISDNLLWVISNLSIQSIRLDNLHSMPAGFKCYLKSTYVNDSLMKLHKSYDYEHNNFSFTLLNSLMSNGKGIKYRYQLIGFDTDKKETEYGVNNVIYNNLLPGEYTFKARAINIDGSTSDEITYLFTIYPPYWKTSWFVTLMVLLVLAIIISLFVFRIQFVKRKLTLENRVKTSEIRTIKAQMNPHFIFNSLNSIQDLILSQDIRKSNHYLSVFADLMRNVLTVSGQDEISIEHEIEILTTYISLEKLRFEDDLHVEINCGLSQIEKEDLKIPSLLIQPYIENAFKHGLLHKKGAKRLEVNFQLLNDGYLTCEIIDNGIGINKSKEIIERRNKTHKSFAGFANQKRIELINDLNPKNPKILLKVSNFNETVLNPGTKLVLKFPL